VPQTLYWVGETAWTQIARARPVSPSTLSICRIKAFPWRWSLIKSITPRMRICESWTDSTGTAIGCHAYIDIMPLWIAWFDAVARSASGLEKIPYLPLDDSGPGRPLLPPERAGVTSLVASSASARRGYRRFLHLFHSRALDLDALTACWARLCLRLLSRRRGERLICLADASRLRKKAARCPPSSCSINSRPATQSRLHHGP